MTKELVLKALIQAYLRQHPTGSVLHHSDRGSQYPSREYQACLQVLDIPFLILKSEDQTHVEAEKVSILHAQ